MATIAPFTFTYTHECVKTECYTKRIEKTQWDEIVYFLFETPDENFTSSLPVIAKLLLANMFHSNKTYVSEYKNFVCANDNQDRDNNCKIIFPDITYNPFITDKYYYRHRIDPVKNYYCTQKTNIFLVQWYDMLLDFCRTTLKWTNIYDIDVHFIDLNINGYVYKDHESVKTNRAKHYSNALQLGARQEAALKSEVGKLKKKQPMRV